MRSLNLSIVYVLVCFVSFSGVTLSANTTFANEVVVSGSAPDANPPKSELAPVATATAQSLPEAPASSAAQPGEKSDSTSTGTGVVSSVSPVPSASPSIATNGESVSSQKLEKSDDSGSRGKFSVTMYTLGGVDDQQLKKYNKSSFAIYDSYISFNYKINKDLRLAARPAFSYTTAGSDFRGNEMTDKISNRDFSFIATQYNLFEDELPTTLDLKQSARLYLPTSDSSKVEGMIARLRYELEMKFYSGRYDFVRAWLKPSYYFQRTTAFIDDFGNTRQTRNTDSTHGAEYNLNLSKLFSIVPGFEVEEKWSYSSQENQCGTARRPVECDVKRSTQIAYRLGLEVRPLKTFNFTLGIQDQRDLINTKVDKNVSYSLLTNLVLY